MSNDSRSTAFESEIYYLAASGETSWLNYASQIVSLWKKIKSLYAIRYFFSYYSNQQQAIFNAWAASVKFGNFKFEIGESLWDTNLLWEKSLYLFWKERTECM